MGEEYGETRPFPFFCSFGDPALVEAVRRGRREEFAALAFRMEERDSRSAGPRRPLPRPSSAGHGPTARRRRQLRRLYQDLLAPAATGRALRDRRHTAAAVHGTCPTAAGDGGSVLLVLQRGGDEGLLAVANLDGEGGLAGRGWNSAAEKLLLSTEDARYGGARGAP